jgi:hypothetical protein
MKYQHGNGNTKPSVLTKLFPERDAMVANVISEGVDQKKQNFLL